MIAAGKVSRAQGKAEADALFRSGLAAGAGLQLLTTQSFLLGCRRERMTDVVFCKACIALLDEDE